MRSIKTHSSPSHEENKGQKEKKINYLIRLIHCDYVHYLGYRFYILTRRNIICYLFILLF